MSLAIEANDNNDLDLTYTRSQSPHYYQFELHRATSANGAYTLYRTVNDRSSPADFDNVTTPRYYKAKGRNCRTSGRTGCGSWSPWTSSIRVPPAVSQSAPVFTQSTYSFDVDEDDAVNTLVGTVTANDPNAGDTVTYSITAGNSAGHFSIGSSTGRITVAGTLNRATNSTYRLTIRASDNHSNSNAATVNITVAATTNRPPAFGQSFYTFSAEESSALNSEVGTVSATDPDTGDIVSYSIQTGNSSGHFGIQSSTGRITVIRTLDYETTSSYTLTVRASDNRGGTSDTTVFITIPAPVPSFQFTPNPMALGGTSNVWTVPSTATSIYLDVDFSAGFTKDSSAGNIVVSTTAPNGSTVRKLVDNENDRGFLSTVASGSSIRISVDSDAFDASLATVTLTFRAAGSSGDVLATAVVRKEARPRAPWRGSASVDAASGDVTLAWEARPPLLGANPDHYEVLVPGATSSATPLYVNRNVSDANTTSSLVITGARARGMLGSHVANIYHCNEAGGCSTVYALSFTVPPAPVAVAPATPTGFEHVNPNYKDARLWWNPVSDAARYQLRYATGGSGPWTVWSVSPTNSSIRISDIITPGVTYRFQVRSVNAGGLNSGWSSSIVASILLEAAITASDAYPDVGDVVILKAYITDQDATGLSYQWQQKSGANWTNLGAVRTTNTRTVISGSMATEEYRVVVTGTGGLSVESLSAFITWGEMAITIGLVEDYNTAVRASTEYGTALTSFLTCMNRSDGSGASGQVATFTDFNGVFSQYTSAMKTKIDACDDEANLYDTIESQTRTKLALFGNATQANLNAINITGLTLVKLRTYADFLSSPSGRDFVQMATDTDLIKYNLGRLAGTEIGGASGAAAVSGLGCLPSSRSVPNLTGKFQALNCLNNSTPYDFWVDSDDEDTENYVDLWGEINDDDNRYDEWLGYVPDFCTSWFDGPTPACRKHDVNWSSLEKFDGLSTGHGVDSAWNPRNKYLADDIFYHDIADNECQDSSWTGSIWCAGVSNSHVRAVNMIFGVRFINNLGWPITNGEVDHARDSGRFLACDIPRLSNIRAAYRGNWTFRVYWTLTKGCVANPNLKLTFNYEFLDKDDLDGTEAYDSSRTNTAGETWMDVSVGRGDRDKIRDNGFALESIRMDATDVKVKPISILETALGIITPGGPGPVGAIKKIFFDDVFEYSTHTVRIRCTEASNGTWTCTSPLSGATGAQDES